MKLKVGQNGDSKTHLPVDGGLLGPGSWLGQQGFLFLRIHCQLYLIEILRSKDSSPKTHFKPENTPKAI